MPFERAPIACPRALSAQATAGAHRLGRFILYGAFGPMEPPWLQNLTRRTAINVLSWIILKGAFRENTLASDMILLRGSIPHVTGRSALSARHIVFLRP